MALDVWFDDDVRRIIAGLACAASRYEGEYRQGYCDALADLAVSFGILGDGMPLHGRPLVPKVNRLDGWRE